MPTLRFNRYNEEWIPCLLSDTAYYLKERKRAIKSIFVSTENMCQNCSGIEQYIDNSAVEGIAFDKNDILIANIRPYLKKAWKATFNGVCSTDVLALHIKKALPDFIYRIIENDDFFTYVMSAAKGSKMPRGDKQHILNYQIALPSVQEQQKISDFLQCLDLRIIKQRQLINSLISYKRGALQYIFASTKTKLPLYQISEYYSSANTMSMIESIPAGIYPVYDAGGVVAKINKFDFNEAYVAIIKDGSGVGRLQLCEPSSSIIGTLGALFPKNCSVGYLYAVLQTIDFRQFVTGMAIPHIYYKDYKSIEVPFPDDISRNKIERLLNSIDTILDKESRLLNFLQLQKGSLLQQLFI